MYCPFNIKSACCGAFVLRYQNAHYYRCEHPHLPRLDIHGCISVCRLLKRTPSATIGAYLSNRIPIRPHNPSDRIPIRPHTHPTAYPSDNAATRCGAPSDDHAHRAACSPGSLPGRDAARHAVLYFARLSASTCARTDPLCPTPRLHHRPIRHRHDLTFPPANPVTHLTTRPLCRPPSAPAHPPQTRMPHLHCLPLATTRTV